VSPHAPIPEMNVSLSMALAMPRIADASPEWLAQFGLNLETCRGRTLNLVTGPESNVQQLASLLETVQTGKQAQANLMLYSRSGEGSLFCVHAKPSCSAKNCELAMRRCDALSFDAAIQEDGSAKVLLEAKKPFKVHHASSVFEKAYGFEAMQLKHRTLSIVSGPLTDVQALSRMVHRALEGSTGTACLQTYLRNGSEIGDSMSHVQVTPVVQDADIKYLLVTMGPSPAKGASNGSEYESSAYAASSAPACTQISPPALTTSAHGAGTGCFDARRHAWRQSSNFHMPCTAHIRLPGKARNRQHLHKQARHADASGSLPQDPATGAFWDSDACPCCLEEECSVKGKAMVVALMVCGLLLSPRDGNYASLLILILSSLIFWCLFDMLAANDTRDTTRVQAKGVERRGQGARCKYARDWALLHAHDDGLEMPWASEDNYSPY